MVNTPLALFDYSIRGGVTITNQGNRKGRLPLLNPASFEAKDASKRKCAEVLTTAKNIYSSRRTPFLVCNSKLRANKCRFKL